MQYTFSVRIAEEELLALIRLEIVKCRVQYLLSTDMSQKVVHFVLSPVVIDF